METTKEKIISYLHSQYWCPLKPNNIEFVASKKVNDILDVIISELEKGDWTNTKEVVARLRSKREYVICENTEDEIQVATLLNSIIHTIIVELKDL